MSKKQSIEVDRIEEGETFWVVWFTAPVQRYRGREKVCGQGVWKREYPDRLSALVWALEVIREQDDE